MPCGLNRAVKICAIGRMRFQVLVPGVIQGSPGGVWILRRLIFREEVGKVQARIFAVGIDVSGLLLEDSRIVLKTPEALFEVLVRSCESICRGALPVADKALGEVRIERKIRSRGVNAVVPRE